MIKTFLFLLLCATPLCAQQITKADLLKPRPTDRKSFTKTIKEPVLIASTATCFAGVTADLLSSRGSEANPLFRNSRGELATGRSAAFNYGLCGGFLLLAKWSPKLSKMLSFTAGGIHFGVAVHNLRLN